MAGKNAVNAFRSSNLRYSAISTQSYNRSSPIREAREAPKRAIIRENIKEKPVVYYCGDIQNDVDSVVLDHVQETVKDIQAHPDKYNNFYTSDLVDDVEEKPRHKRVGKRQQIIESKSKIL